MDNLLNKESGLKGLCGSNDLRDINSRIAQGDSRAKLAHDMFTSRVKKYIGYFSLKYYGFKYFQYEIYETEIIMSTPESTPQQPRMPGIAILSV